jgi:hypothetical protein
LYNLDSHWKRVYSRGKLEGGACVLNSKQKFGMPGKGCGICMSSSRYQRSFPGSSVLSISNAIFLDCAVVPFVYLK